MRNVGIQKDMDRKRYSDEFRNIPGCFWDAAKNSRKFRKEERQWGNRDSKMYIHVGDILSYHYDFRQFRDGFEIFLWHIGGLFRNNIKIVGISGDV